MRTGLRRPLAPRTAGVALTVLFVVMAGSIAPISPGRAVDMARASTSQDYKLAPPDEELESRAEEYILNRRITAILLVGGTLIGGALGSVMRRRARRRARELEASRASEED